MRTSWKMIALAPLGALLLGITGCDRFLRALGVRTNESTVERVENNSGERIGTQSLSVSGESKILSNETAGIQLTLPTSWDEDSRLHESAELQASDAENQLFIIVVAEEDEALLRVGLRENAEKYRNLLINQLATFESQTPTDVAFVGENFAAQSEIRGRVDDNTPVIYLHTTVVTERRYYQIVAWTTPDQYNFYKSELQAITDTFREIDS